MSQPEALGLPGAGWDRLERLYPVVSFEGLLPVDKLRAQTYTEIARLVGWFFISWPKFLDDNDVIFRGYSLRQSQKEWLLVVRLTSRGIPRVGFCSGDHPMGCIKNLLRMVQEDKAIFYPDKFA